MPSRFKDRILRHLKHDAYTPTEIDVLAEDLGVSEVDMEDFRRAVEHLVQAGQTVVTDRGRLELPTFGDELVGEFRGNPRGFGFVVPRDPMAHGDLFIPPDATQDALTGDIVRAAVHKEQRGRGKGRSPYYGVIQEVIERKRSKFTGVLRKKGGDWLVMPDGKALTDPVIVRDPGAKNAGEDDKVVIEISRYPEGRELAEGVIVKVLGEAGEPDVETQAVIEAYSLPGEFPEECVEQARSITRMFEKEIEQAIDKGEGWSDRADLRDKHIITIDPPDARDFDDAISIERIEEGWRLGVHIADVAHFIEPGSPLDEEAKNRGNSVYLPRMVIPMLPELLSNGICSLQEGVPRYCKSAFIDYDNKGRVRGTGFAQTCIESAKRLTYIEAQALMEGDVKLARQHAKTEPNYSEELIDTLKSFNTLATKIRERRHKNGMIHLDLPEVELIFDDDGRVVDAEREDDSFTHTIIEMFMVESNEAVARLFEDLHVPLLRRVHPEPTPGEFETLQDFVKVAGFKIPKNPTREEIQGILDATAGTPAAPAVHFAILRTFTKAEYSPAIIGHFALASDAYAHFTSPIRRYPDLTVHRALAEYLSRTNNGENRPRSDKARKNMGKDLRDSSGCPDEQTLQEIGRNCSRTEQNATDAERDLRAFLVLQLMSQRIGAEYEGIVTGVTNGGVFVQLSKYLIEGRINSEDLPVPQNRGGRWRVDQKSGALVHEGTGRSYKMGDRVKVIVAEVDLAARKMDLLIPDEEAKKRSEIGKALKIGSAGGGLGAAAGAGFDAAKLDTGAKRRSRKSKSRDKRKSEHRTEKKNKGKRQ